MPSDSGKRSKHDSSTAFFRLPNWMAAHQRVLTLLPGAQDRLPFPYSLTPDRICAAAEDAAIQFQFVSLPSIFRDTAEQRRHWENSSKAELYDEVFGLHPPLQGDVLFIPQQCIRENVEPNIVRGEDLRTHVLSRQFFVFDGDVIFVWQHAPRITVFHHEGGFAHIHCETGSKG